MNTEVLISIGSNYLPSVNVQWGTERLRLLLTDMKVSRSLWTEDVNHSGSWYMNRMIKASTVMTYEELNNWMKAIEREAFRYRHCVTLDLDILLYGTKRYHEKDWTRPYVQLLLPDVGIM